MASNDTNVILNNYSDDSQIKTYIADVLMPRVFHDIPINVLNTGFFSVASEYMSQVIENLAFTSSFYLNESFITKAVLSDSIYAEAAIFNIGYAFATASACNFMMELKIDEIKKNAKENPDNGLMEFILDKDTKINLKNGNVYSFDYDVLIQFTDTDNPTWNVQYTNMDEHNFIAVNKTPYILYRTSHDWLHIFVTMSEYTRQHHVVVNNMTNGIPNADSVITCQNHICGFEVKYTDSYGNSQYLDRDHILPMHSDVKDQGAYVHYIMDSPNTIRFVFQRNGNRYFVPQMNSSFDITIYTCHGDAANFSSFRTDESVSVITSTNKYSNNGNVQKTAFVMSGSLGGTNIGTVETTRRETIEAYNTANVISSDHDIYEWFKTFFFKRILYPFFFKRRDDPWGRIWSGFLALTDDNGDVFRTNTLHAKIPYRILYSNNDNTISNNEIIIPPGWAWIYDNPEVNRYTTKPLVVISTDQVETAMTALNVDSDYVFANPFGIRIQKEPFAVGYFNPWINDTTTTSIVATPFVYTDDTTDDTSIIYHGTPAFVQIKRTYINDYYTFSTVIIPNQSNNSLAGSDFVQRLRMNAEPPKFPEVMWTYFMKPSDLFNKQIPILVRNGEKQYLPFNPDETYLCVRTKDQTEPNKWVLTDLWIEDHTYIDPETGDYKTLSLPINGFASIYGTNDIWGDEGKWKGYEVKVSGDTDISIYPSLTEDSDIEFGQIPMQSYYEMRIREEVQQGRIIKMVTQAAFETSLTKYGETKLYRIGRSYDSPIFVHLYFDDGTDIEYRIFNAANVYTPYEPIDQGDGTYRFELDNVSGNGIILYADMKPTASDSAIAYYRIPLSTFQGDNNTEAIFYLESNQLPLDENLLRVILEARVNGVSTGRVEMQPVKLESDGSIRFEVNAFPLNKLVDIDNRIRIASVNNGGGSWIPSVENGIVSVDATEPELMLYIMFKSDDPTLPSPFEGDTDYIGYRLQDRWNVDNISLVQELKEMRSVVDFGEYIEPSELQIEAYDKMMALIKFDSSTRNLYTVKDFAYHIITGTTDDSGITFDDIKTVCLEQSNIILALIAEYSGVDDVPDFNTEFMQIFLIRLEEIQRATYAGDVDWEWVYEAIHTSYPNDLDTSFAETSVNSSVEIQLMPFIQSTLMTSESFETFVSAFTQVHKAIEPVIFKRLEGNNYLDCKLIATYGLPHSYVSDVDKTLDTNEFWPDLNVQIEFAVKLYNPALRTNTLNELKSIIKSYFNRLTTVHTPVDMISMDNNIYISQLIKLLEEHSNVAYLKFRGWYTNEKAIRGGKYMNADYQAIVQKWDTLEDMPRKELERYVPEMFVLDDSSIVIDIL